MKAAWEPGPYHTLSLSVSDGAETRSWYEIDLKQCRTSAEVLDWIAQIAKKPWCTHQILADLVRELDKELGLQSNLCGGGEEQGPIDVPKTRLKHRTHYEVTLPAFAEQLSTYEELPECVGCGREVERAEFADGQGRSWHHVCAQEALLAPQV